MLTFRSFLRTVKGYAVKHCGKTAVFRLAKCYAILKYIDKCNRHVYRFCNGESYDGFGACIFQSRPVSYTVCGGRLCRKDNNFTFSPVNGAPSRLAFSVPFCGGIIKCDIKFFYWHQDERGIGQKRVLEQNLPSTDVHRQTSVKRYTDVHSLASRQFCTRVFARSYQCHTPIQL